MTTLGDRYYYYLYYHSKDTKAQKVTDPAQSHMVNKSWNWLQAVWLQSPNSDQLHPHFPMLSFMCKCRRNTFAGLRKYTNLSTNTHLENQNQTNNLKIYFSWVNKSKFKTLKCVVVTKDPLMTLKLI